MSAVISHRMRIVIGRSRHEKRPEHRTRTRSLTRSLSGLGFVHTNESGCPRVPLLVLFRHSELLGTALSFTIDVFAIIHGGEDRGNLPLRSLTISRTESGFAICNRLESRCIPLGHLYRVEHPGTRGALRGSAILFSIVLFVGIITARGKRHHRSNACGEEKKFLHGKSQ